MAERNSLMIHMNVKQSTGREWVHPGDNKLAWFNSHRNFTCRVLRRLIREYRSYKAHGPAYWSDSLTHTQTQPAAQLMTSSFTVKHNQVIHIYIYLFIYWQKSNMFRQLFWVIFGWTTPIKVVYKNILYLTKFSKKIHIEVCLELKENFLFIRKFSGTVNLERRKTTGNAHVYC
jgi:hypothetical protein